jgi:tRNA threonylcarbamoyladenosine biosynthesis protein TsaE
MVSIFLADAVATKNLGKQLGQSLPPKSVILLEGDLGAGKTTLIQGIGEGLGISEAIVSPTFTLINEYTEGRLPLYHIDLYRLSSDGVDSLHPEIYWEGIEVTPGITAIEWAQRLPYKPLSYLQIKLKFHPQQGREAQLSAIGELELVVSG